jgi:hypothetical protein
VRAAGVALDVRTQLLYEARDMYRERRAKSSPGARTALHALADDARSCARVPRRAGRGVRLLYDWYRHGYAHPAPDGGKAANWRVDTLAEQVAALDGLSRSRTAASSSSTSTSRREAGSGGDASMRSRASSRERNARFDVIVHETRWMESSAPRFVQLLRQYGHAMTLYRTGAEATTAMDPLLIVDQRHFVHRLHIDQTARDGGMDVPAGESRCARASTRSGRPASRASPGRCWACSRQRLNDRLK